MILKLVCVFSLCVLAFAGVKDGLSQEYLNSTIPTPYATNVLPNSVVKIKYNQTVDKKSIHKATVTLKKGNISILGTTSVKTDTLIFTPNTRLNDGVYSLHVKKVKFDLPKVTMSDMIEFSFEVSSIKALEIVEGDQDIKLGETLPLNIKATLNNGTTTNLVNNVEWMIQDSSIISINQNNLVTSLKEGSTSIYAMFDTFQTLPVNITVYQEINGHRLPPEPDPAINNSTILGIDSNDNGVRDDVERKIYVNYTKPIEQAFMMQDAKSYPKILNNPIIAATSEEVEQENWNYYSCIGYLRRVKGIRRPKGTVEFLENAYMNTRERIRAYIEFNEASSGGVYSMPIHDEDLKPENCDFDVEAVLGAEQ